MPLGILIFGNNGRRQETRVFVSLLFFGFNAVRVPDVQESGS